MNYCLGKNHKFVWGPPQDKIDESRSQFMHAMVEDVGVTLNFFDIFNALLILKHGNSDDPFYILIILKKIRATISWFDACWLQGCLGIN